MSLRLSVNRRHAKIDFFVPNIDIEPRPLIKRKAIHAADPVAAKRKQDKCILMRSGQPSLQPQRNHVHSVDCPCRWLMLLRVMQMCGPSPASIYYVPFVIRYQPIIACGTTQAWICYGLEKGDYILRVARFANLPLISSGNETSLFHSKHIKLTCRQNVSIWCLKVELRTGEAASDSNPLAAS